jgi:hypothetical protein
VIIKEIYLFNVGYFYGLVKNYKVAVYFSKSSYKSGCSADIFKTQEQKLPYLYIETYEYPTLCVFKRTVGKLHYVL